MGKLKYASEIFSPRFSETVLAETDTRFSRQRVKVAVDAGPLPFGLVLARAATGLGYEPYKGAEGQKARAILLTPLDETSGSREAVIIGGYAILNENNLVWDAAVTDKASALNQLADAGFVIKKVEVGNGIAE